MTARLLLPTRKEKKLCWPCSPVKRWPRPLALILYQWILKHKIGLRSSFMLTTLMLRLIEYRHGESSLSPAPMISRAGAFAAHTCVPDGNLLELYTDLDRREWTEGLREAAKKQGAVE